MATELVKKEVDGSVYEFEQFGAKEALKTLVRLSKIAGPSIGVAMGAFKADSEVDANLFAKIIEPLVSRMDEDEVLTLVEKLTSEPKVLCDGKKIRFDTHYERRLPHLFKVLMAALEVQYGNFFEEMLALSSQALQGNTPPQKVL